MINVGNFGLPLIYFSFGEQAQVYSVLYFTAFNIPLSTIAIYISSKEKSMGKILTDVIKIPMFHALVIALFISGMSITLPDFLSKSIGLISQAAIPLFIFILGLQLASMKLKFGFVKIVLLAVCIRLVVSPALAYPFLELIGISGLERKIAVVQTSAPAALLPLMYAIRFNRSPDLLAAIIFATTLLSGISLTVLLKFVHLAP
jgi:predicted permease